ncbi:MAG: FHA domain-containing protein [Pseudomonadota bacterium]
MGTTQGVASYRDTELAAQQLTLGSSPDQSIQLLGVDVRGAHAVLRPAGAGRLQVQCRRRAEVLVNGSATRSATLSEGDVLEVGGHRLRVIEAPAGFDGALELVRDPAVDSSAYEAAFTTDLDQTWLSRRGPAWGSLALVLVVTLVLPLAYVMLDDDDEAVAVAPTDTLWSSGPLHPAHALATGDDCSSCHSELFHRVKDDDCTACHDALPDHVPETRAAALDMEHTRCASCHLEHNEPEHLINTSDRLCTDCHAEPHEFEQEFDVAAVSGFAEGAHPAFEARLLRPVVTDAGTGLAFDWSTHREAVATAEERSNLAFPHDIHLDPGKVRDPNDDGALACNDCHTLAADREHFRPIDMETHCAECHELTFDPTAPERQLPHGQPREVVFAIEGHFARKYLDPDSSGAAPTRRRRPGRSAGAGSCTDGPLTCARERTRAEVVNQFTTRGCVTCHEVTETDSTDLYSRFQVHPVRLVGDYFTSARFDHASHLTQEGKTGDAACLSCHGADVSNTSNDLLIPDMDNCTACHGDRSVPEVVTLQCVACHEYHPHAEGMGPGRGNVGFEGVAR